MAGGDVLRYATAMGKFTSGTRQTFANLFVRKVVVGLMSQIGTILCWRTGSWSIWRNDESTI